MAKKRENFQLDPNKHADIISFLARIDNKSAFIRMAIRNAMKQENMSYMVTPIVGSESELNDYKNEKQQSKHHTNKKTKRLPPTNDVFSSKDLD